MKNFTAHKRRRRGREMKHREGWLGRNNPACSLKTSSVNPDGLLSNPEQTIYKFSARLKSTN